MRRFVLPLLCATVLLLVVSCNQKKADAVVEDVESVEVNPAAIGVGKIDQNDTLPGKKVQQVYADNQARDVLFYKVDENGQLTDEIYREVHYFDSTHYKYIEGNIEKAQRDGAWYAYHKNGNLCTEAYYVDGKEEGDYKVYHDNGIPYYAGKYKNGMKTGVWKFYGEDGKLMYTETYRNGQKVKTELVSEKKSN